ncbi:MAG: hypothetical protein HY349_06795 [Nitrospirae bacterium]|nr:hypothetical protein [Nitrospirota bacterium]
MTFYRIRFLTSMIMVITLGGCTGKLDYIRPVTDPRVENSKIIDKHREAVWNAAVPTLGKQFFVINNLDKSSGFINLSYTGDPEAYVDCGRIVSYVKNLRGERTYDFAGAKAEQSYEVMNDAGLFFIQRKMSLDGRVNIVFEEIGPDRTRVTANTRYVLSRYLQIQDLTRQYSGQNTNNSITFNSGSGASFPATGGRATECVATGKLERDILSLIN